MIEVSEGAEALAAALAARGRTAAVDGGRLTIEGAGDEDYDAVRDALVESGALLYRLAPQRHELTELFTGGAEPATDAGLPAGEGGGAPAE